MKNLSKFLILFVMINFNIINCKLKLKKARKSTYDSISHIRQADSIRPSDISRELFCDACQAFFTEASKNLRNLNKESDVVFYLNSNNICSYKNFDGYHFSNPELEVACEVLIGEYYDEIEKILIERNPIENTNSSLINKFCYKTIKACNGVDLSKLKPIDAEIIDGQIYEKETEEKVFSVIPRVEEVDIGNDDLNEENKTSTDTSAEL